MDGIIPLWKPKGLTSHDCVFKIRKIVKMKKVGHTGTLDPDVEGVLPICLGRATKIAEYITDAGKVYEGEVTLGYSTTTEDASGEKVAEKHVEKEISLQEVKQALDALTGEITQIPPMYSAVKVKGKKLYEYARAGIEVERPARQVHIYELTLLDTAITNENGLASFRFRVHCSKGTYIRTLAVMLGEILGYPAHMSKLVRTASATFTADDCVTFTELENTDTIETFVYPLEKGIFHLPQFQLDEILAKKVQNGMVLDIPMDWPSGHVAMKHQGEVIAIYQTHPEKHGMIKPVKVLKID
ncbi:tRNA pseudouridine(55) synthase TruB [Bacillus sp. FJAT-50079]|uniref:tRNA pseudouridine(55) synthase TruB n=1 Tax=Bacillus sp. FJAT-50079 TaxID=2833577 RepID=UPI001BCA3529|nr:tRNA pseudouridine(55) synthase TruB [Bacillus sp. FJAT-50079]MBS4207579.1 tRNA pseudouridine(55) synthase TruB [Bacillus sp. FJAT-50079]